MAASIEYWRCCRRAGTVMPINVAITSVTNVAETMPMRAARNPMKRTGLALMLLAIAKPVHKLASAIGRTNHLTRQAATSPADTIVQNPIRPGFCSIKSAIMRPMKAAAIATPLAQAKLARPKEGS